MPDTGMLEDFLAGACVDAAVFALRPTAASCCWLSTGSSRARATRTATRCCRRRRPQPARRSAAGRRSSSRTWRRGGRHTGRSGPSRKRTRNSLEALLRRAGSGLPRVNRLTDLYNAVSVLHQIPLGGEDLTRYAGPPRLIRAAGTEPFDTIADGIGVIEHPDPGEVVWCDDAGVTCRRWNWRQARRTQLREDTSTALFILDALDPVTGQALHAAADDLLARLARLGPDVRSARRLIAADPALDEGD